MSNDNQPRKPNENAHQYWVRTHREHYNELLRNWRSRNREAWNAYQRDYHKKRRESDPEYVKKRREYTRIYYRENNRKETGRVYANKNYHEDYNHRKKKLEYSKRRYREDPQHREKMLAYSREYNRKKRTGEYTPKRAYKKAETKNVLLPLFTLIWRLTCANQVQTSG